MPRLIPYRAAYAIPWVAERWATMRGHKDGMLTTDAIYLSNVFRKMDNDKARRELGWTPRPLSETIRDAIEWFDARENVATGLIVAVPEA